MKKILSLLTILTVLGIPTVSAHAASHSSTNQSGSAMVNRITTRTTVSGGTFTDYVGGGVWQYGFSGTDLFSQYDHDELTHRSSVQNSNSGSLTRSGWKSPGSTAYVSIAQTLKGNQTFWATK